MSATHFQMVQGEKPIFFVYWREESKSDKKSSLLTPGEKAIDIRSTALSTAL